MCIFFLPPDLFFSRRQIESALNGAIYDSYVRFITWEGILGWWQDEYLTWASCPSNSIPYDGINPASLLLQPPDYTSSSSSSQQVPFTASTIHALDDLPVCPLHWATPIHALQCNSTLIWPRFLSDVPPHPGHLPPTPAKELIELDTPAYAGRIRKELVIEKLLATAGIRLAAILNELLDPEGIAHPTGGVWGRDIAELKASLGRS